MAASRRKYTVAKRWHRVRAYGTILLVLLTPLAIRNPSLRTALAIASPIWAALSVLGLAQVERHVHELAVLLQEQFDRLVFGLAWNASLGRKLADLEVVHFYDQTSQRQRKSVTDWYPVSPDTDGLDFVLRCQHGNLVWSRKLHHSYRWIVMATSIAGCIYALGFSLHYKVTLDTFLIAVVLPSIPGLLLAFNSFIDHSDAGSNGVRVVTFIDDLLHVQGRDFSDVQSVQDRICELRRRAPLVPDAIYWATRKRMNTSLREVLAEPLVDL